MSDVAGESETRGGSSSSVGKTEKDGMFRFAIYILTKLYNPLTQGCRCFLTQPGAKELNRAVHEQLLYFRFQLLHYASSSSMGLVMVDLVMKSVVVKQ